MPEINSTPKCVGCGDPARFGFDRCRRCAKKLKNRLRGERAAKRAEKIRPLTYDERDAVIRGLGFESYKHYLQSDLWRTIRTQVYQKHGHKCYVCRAAGRFRVPATEVHHRRYSLRNLSGKSIFGMFPVCRTCHTSVEFKNGQKVTTKKAYQLFNRACDLNRS